MELKDQVKRLQSYLSGLSDVIELKDQNSVYWLAGRAKEQHLPAECTLDIASLLREEIFPSSSVLLTSATITRVVLTF